MIYKRRSLRAPKSELGCAATSETAAKCEGESAAGGGNQPEPSIGGFLRTVGETPAQPATPQLLQYILVPHTSCNYASQLPSASDI